MDWKLTNILPKLGGTLDQDAQFMKDLRTIMGIEGQIDKVKQEKAKIKADIESKLNRKGK